jgi:hypothetical protein
MADDNFLQQLFGSGDITGLTGLLTPPENRSPVTRDFFQTLGAGMMKAGGPSPYKAGMTWGSGIGEGLSSAITARSEAQKNLLNEQLVKATTMDKAIPFYQLALKYDQAGEARPKYLQDALDAMTKHLQRSYGYGSPNTALAAGLSVPGAPGAPGAGAPAAGAGTAPNNPRDILRAAGFTGLTAAEGGAYHEAAMDYLKRYMAENDPEHRLFLQQQELFKNRLPDVMKEIGELQKLNLPITEQTVAPLRAAGASEKFIKQLTGGKIEPASPPPQAGGLPGTPGGAPAPGGMPPPGTLPPNMAALLGAGMPPPAGGVASSPPAPPPTAGPPAGPPPAAAGPPPQSPLRVAGPTPPTFLAPPAGAQPPAPMPPPAAPPPATPAPATPAPAPPTGRPAIGENINQQLNRLGITPEQMQTTHPEHAAAMDKIKADIAEQAGYRTEAQKKALEAEYGERKAIFDERLAHDKKQMPLWASIGANAIATIQNNQLSRDLITDKNFKSGLIGQSSETWNAVKAAFGIDPNAAFSQQVFNKVTAKNALDSLEGLKDQSAMMEGSGAGKVLLQEYNTILKQVQSLGIGESSNIFLSRLTDNLAKQQLYLSKLALKIKEESKDGLLDDTKFTREMIKYLEENPAYTSDMLAQAKEEGRQLAKDKANNVLTTEPRNLKVGTKRNTHDASGNIVNTETWNGREWVK